MKLIRNLMKRAGIAAAASVPVLANAAQDVTAVTGAATDIAAVGAAVFGVYVAIKLTKWVRRAL